MLEVVAAILRREGRILICQRRPEQAHPLKWEFPGGKVEAGETAKQAVVRELREELGIVCKAGLELERYEFSYPGKNPLLLIFVEVNEFEGEPQNLIFHAMRWVFPERLAEFDFLEGDRDFLRRLAG